MKPPAIVRIPGLLLDGPLVSKLEADLRATGTEGTGKIVVDCSAVRELTAEGLSGLLELGARVASLWHVVLAALPKPLLQAATDVGLSERFPVYESVPAAERALLEDTPEPLEGAKNPPALRALIYEIPGHPGVGSLDVAGRPLLVRQLQILRELGIEDVVVEVCEGRDASGRARLLLGPDPLVSRVVVIPSSEPLGHEELARRGGFARGELYVALPATLLARPTALPQESGTKRFALRCPGGALDGALELAIERLGGTRAEGTTPLEGWAAQIEHESAAHELGCAVIEGRAPGVLIHAAEIRSGVWVARGAHIADDAEIHPPVWIGEGAFVMSRAKVGPRALIGERCVIERGAVVAEAAIERDTIVGEATIVQKARADAHGMTSFADASRTSVKDAFVLAPRRVTRTALSSRICALVLLALLALPWLIASAARRARGQRSIAALAAPHANLRLGTLGIAWLDLLPALIDALQGHRDLVGVSDERALSIAFSRPHSYALRAGALDISRALAPSGSTSTLLRMWRWYQAHKSARLDRRLWGRRKAI